MNTPRKCSLYLMGLMGLMGLLAIPASAGVSVLTLTPSVASPQPIGTAITWTATATDSSSGPLTFQFNVAHPGGQPFLMARDFNIGTLSSSTWTSQPFVWTPTGIEGTYQIQVVAKDFSTGQSATTMVNFTVRPLVTGSQPVVVHTANPLVALFSAPSCAIGSVLRVNFKRTGSRLSNLTPWVPCRAPATMTVEIAGLRPNSVYEMFAQVETGGKAADGPTVSFTTSTLPSSVPFPKFKSVVSPGKDTDRTDSIILHNPTQLGGGTHYPDIATDLLGNILWYYYPSDLSHSDILTRPLTGGTFLAIENGPSWNPASEQAQLLRQIDLAGNVVKETNIGILAQQLRALGATNANLCSSIASPAPLNSACLGAFHHDFIGTLPNGGYAAIADVEKILPPGTQGDNSGLNVDVVGDMIIVMNSSFQVTWYFDTFEKLDVSRTAILGEKCGAGQAGCPPIFLLSSTTAQKANDWLHANSLYYWPQDHDILLSLRHQDWVVKIDYNDGNGTGNVLWHMGPNGDFSFNNVNNDPWPWFSHQHEVGIELGGTGVMTLFDNGNTRVQPPPVGEGSGNSRGMVLNVDETHMKVTPVLSQDLGYFSTAEGSAQLLSNGDYFFLPGIVLFGASNAASFSMEIFPTHGTVNGTTVLNLRGTESYRAWQMSSMYTPPTT
jgi:arylsulfate sulfotransferase